VTQQSKTTASMSHSLFEEDLEMYFGQTHVTSIESWKELYSRFQLILLLETTSAEYSTLMAIRTTA
jgi:hypothetical protein